MKNLNLIEWLRKTDSHEKQKVRGMQKYCILLLLLFTCITHAYAGEYAGGAVYFDNSVTNWSYTHVYLIIGKDSWSTTYQMEPMTGTSYYHVSLPKGGWSDATYIAVAAKDGSQSEGSWSDVSNKFTKYSTKKTQSGGLSRATYILTPSSSSNGFSFTLSSSTSIFSSCPTDVLNDTKIMVYAGEAWSWDQGFYRFMSTNNTSNTVATAAIRGIKKNLTNIGDVGFGPALLASGTYYQGHWASGLSKSISAGKAYMVYSKDKASDIGTALVTSGDNSLYNVTKVNSSPTTSVTTTIGSSSFAEGTSSLSVSTGSAGKSVMNSTNTIEYYLYNGSTWSKVTVSAGSLNVASLEEGSYKLATVLYDGYIYVKADEDNFSVYAVYSITYRDKDDEDYSGDNLALLPTSYNHGTGIASLTAGVKDGYIFNGWFDDSSCTGDPVTSISSSATGDKTFYAKWTSASTYRLTYYANYDATGTSGTAPAAADYARGSTQTVADENTLAMTNYDFAGWNTEQYITGTHYDAGDDITMSDNINLYAEWTRSIPMDDQGATTGVSTTVYGTYNCTTLTEHTNPAKTGYTFGGWYSEIAGAGSYVISPEHVLQASKNHWTDAGGRFTRYPSSTSSLYAKWTQTVSLKANTGNHGSGTDKTATATWNKTSITIPTHCSPATGYSLDGYYTAATGGTKILNANGSYAEANITVDTDPYISSSKWVHPGATTLYAQYTPNVRTITFAPNGGTVTPTSASVTYDAAISNAPIPTKTGYNFTGYNTAGGASITTNAGVFKASVDGFTDASAHWVKDANATITAQWTAKTTAVTLDRQSGTTGSTGVTATFDAAMPDATMPTRLGYDFGGYYTSTGGSGTQYYTSGGASARNWNIEDANKTLYAKWTAHDYTITYNLNGGTGATNTTYTILSSLITLPTAPTVNKTGYTFGGWYDNSSFTGSAVTSIAAGSTGNKEYWAKWTEIKVSISPTVNSVGTAQGYTASATVGSIGIATTTVLTAEEPGEGYSFNTWDLSSNLVITSGSLTNRSITVRTNGDGNSVTAEAQYVENNYVRLYLKNASSWGTPKAYIWYSTDASDKNKAWAGVEMTHLCADYYVYEYNRTLHSNWDKVIFSNDGSSQTSNLDIAGHEGMCYNNSTGKWEEFTYANTFYFVNSEGWEEVWIYHYGGTNGETNFGTWKGTEMEKVGTVTIDGHAFDYYGAPDGICDDLDGNYIINNGQSGSAKKQTRDIAGNASLLGKYYLADGCFIAADSQTDDTKPTGTLYSASEILSARIGCTDAVDFALIHDINLSPSRVPPLATIMATPDMTKKRAVDQAYCWGVYTDAACTRQVSNVSFISLGDGTVQFAAPETQGTYYLKLTVRASDACDASIDAEKVVSFTVTTEDMVFFKNVPGWGNVHFYYLGKAYWNGSVDGDDGLGSGCNTSVDGGAARGMTRIGNSDIYYYDYSGNSTIKTHLASNPITYIAFTDNYKPTSDHFSGCQAIYRGDFSACAPMLVPENYITCHKNTSAGDGSAAYYQRGYWTNYMSESSGFTLYVWDKTTSGTGSEVTHHEMTGTAGNNTYTFTYNFKDDPTGQSMPYIYGFKVKGCGGSYYGAGSTMDITNCTDWNLGTGTNNCGLSVTAQMEHTFILTLAGDGHVQVSVEYPVRVGDYRLLYDDETQDPQSSQFIRQRANGKDTVAMYIRPTATEELKVQRCSGIDGETITWTDYDWKTDVDTIYVAGKPNGVYNFYLEQDASGNLTVNTSETKPYTGQYYIRTSVVDGGWNSYKSSADNLMTYAQYPDDRGYGFNYYKAKWVEATGSDVTYTIACDYSPALCKTLEGDPENNPLSAAEARNLPHSANIRFGWHSRTNQLKREYINGSSTISDRYLVMIGDSKLMNPDGTPLAISGLNANEISFTDLNNWIYRCDVKAQEGAAVRLVANYDGHTQDFIGSEGEPEEIIGGTGSEKYVMRVTYDFKTNRLMTAWLPSGNIDKDMTLKADMLLVRKGQNAATQVHFTGAYSISEIHTIYGVLEFQYDSIAGKFSSWSSTNAYKYLMYYLSFPFDVKVSEIFGCGVRGTNWIIQKYNGAKRAQIGWFAETSTFWETLPGDSTLHANEGYLLILDRISFNDASSSLWYKQGSGNSIYLYFPSTSATSGTISESTATIKVPEHTCTINRSFYVDEKIGTVNHKNTDSHWNVIGTPLFENKTATTIATPAPDGDGATTLQYYYAWDYGDNSLIARSALTTSTVFKSMHGYMVQYAGDVTFEGAKLTPPPASVAARHMPSDKKNYLIELKMVNENGKSSDAYVELRENACDSFALNEDMYMMRSSSKADLYTFAGNYDVAANVLSMNNHIVPVGMDVKRAGTYRFTMPSEFSGTVTLIDTETGVRTNLALGDYEVNLPKGTSNNRFFLEINIHQMPTAIDGAGGSLKDGKAHKFIENGQMYILQNGIIYDARGNRVR